MARRAMGWGVVVGFAMAFASACSSERPPPEVSALRLRLKTQLDEPDRAPASRLGLARALRYLDSEDDAVTDGTAHGWVDDWIVGEAALTQFAGPRPVLDQRLRARVALAASELTAGERAALHEALVGLLLDPMVLGMGESGEVERRLANLTFDTTAQLDAAWRRDVPEGAVKQWLEVPERVERSSAGTRVWLRDGSQLVLPN
ncbi:MAG: hypothetical protein QM817_30300 [Archangium sp.]